MSLLPPELSTAIATAKAIAGVAKEAGKIELQAQVLDLQSSLLAALKEHMELVEENATLRREAATLRSEIEQARTTHARRGAMKLEHGMYFEMAGSAVQEGPFCPKCLDGSDRYARMVDKKNGFTCCPVCNYCADTPGHSFSNRHIGRTITERDDDY